MTRRLYIIVLFLALIVTPALRAQQEPLPHSGFFCYAPYGQSLYADVHPNCVRLDMAFHSNHTAYDWEGTGDKNRVSSMGVFGVNLPIWRGEFCNNLYGVNITMAASATIWLDLFERITAPVINTDYRIGLPTVTFIHRVNKRFVRNYSIAFSPAKHESTHIGDELQIVHLKQDYPLRRVNVSNNYTEFAFTLNEPEDRTRANHTFRLGLQLLLSPRAKWYYVHADDGDPSLLSTKTTPWELWLQYQYQSPTSKHGFQGIASAEIRNRALYGYTYNGVGLQEERRIFTYNIFLGVRYNTPGYDGYFSRFALGLRGYYGNCPYGQFRNLPNFAQVGLSLIFQ